MNTADFAGKTVSIIIIILAAVLVLVLVLKNGSVRTVLPSE